ncbi:hypothetical protein EG329_004809 [Mollisiaceae sp. DMI_Dod_QoI]|nr:hypothetical protein EG329_004809 [Helotiales sp. DMI_Dod_QoI]
MDRYDTNWKTFQVAELKEALKERALPISGLKVDLIGRLEKYDEERRPVAPRAPPARSPNEVPLERPRFPSGGHAYDRREGRVRTPSPYRSRTELQYTPRRVSSLPKQNLDEAELEQICRENFMPKQDCPTGPERRASIKAEFEVKATESKIKRDAAIERIEKKYQKEMTALEKDRDVEAKALEAEIRAHFEKQRNWGPAFYQLKELRAARGLSTHPNDYDPNNPFRRRAPPTRASPISKSTATVTFNTSRPTPLKRRVSEMAATTASSESANKRPREDGHPKPSPSHPQGRREDGHPKSSPSHPQERRQDGHPKSSPIPTRLRAESLIENIPIRPQLSKQPYIFIDNSDIRVLSENVDLFRHMITKRGYGFKTVRADDTGYFIVFEDSEQGIMDAQLCHNWFDGEVIGSKVMRMQLFNYL